MKNVRACVFDAYGTLFDVHAPVMQLASEVGDHAEAMSQLWRQKQLEYTWLRSLMSEHADFAQVTSDALDYAFTLHGVNNEELRLKLLKSYRELEPFPDAKPTLSQLRGGGLKTAILSNGNPDMLDATVSSAGLTALLDDVISIEDAGIFKPHPSVYQLALDRLEIDDPAHICFVSANTWDVQAGANFGFSAVRLMRSDLPDDNIPGRPASRIGGLSELVTLVN